MGMDARYYRFLFPQRAHPGRFLMYGVLCSDMPQTAVRVGVALSAMLDAILC